MMKKLGIILLSIAFLLSAFSFLPVKRASANTGPERCMLMAAEPWDWLSHPGKGGSGGDSGPSGGDNQGVSDPANHSMTQYSSNSSTQIGSYQGEHREITKPRSHPSNWWMRFLLFWQMVFRK